MCQEHPGAGSATITTGRAFCISKFPIIKPPWPCMAMIFDLDKIPVKSRLNNFCRTTLVPSNRCMIL